MGKTTNPKPRLAYAIDNESKDFLEEWASTEGRSVANLVERLLLDAIAKKKQASTGTVAPSGMNTSDKKN